MIILDVHTPPSRSLCGLSGGGIAARDFIRTGSVTPAAAGMRPGGGVRRGRAAVYILYDRCAFSVPTLYSVQARGCRFRRSDGMESRKRINLFTKLTLLPQRDPNIAKPTHARL
ncbi:hypothetical protein EVAR_88118_1 [Eumeta japonica]|uniref:Uncharacterized protein n=1 Tax=Eumeta variegata TaxID=151549 RepID=A0A4C1WSZ2_EUMVA|nr:hypothetical protein EVAR_88118_1 [Eumeta japonica]